MLAEISDKVSLPIDAKGGALTLAAVALTLAIILGVKARLMLLATVSVEQTASPPRPSALSATSAFRLHRPNLPP